MTLWNKETENNPKPKWLSDDEKARCYCDDRGWVLVHLDGTEEVLVAGAGLNNPADDLNADTNQKVGAVAQKDIQLADPDGDGVPTYQDPAPNDANIP